MVYHILFNPFAGNGRCTQDCKKVEPFLKGGECRFTDMTKISDYGAFLAGVSDADALVLCGGDGTLNRFINDTAELTLPKRILYFATGSGNDFLHDIGGTPLQEPTDITKYLKDLPIVTVKGKDYRVLNGVGYGIDGYCCEVGDKLRATSKKPVNYTSIAIKGLLFHYKPTNATVIADGKEYRFDKVWLVPTMNGRFYGGGMMPTPAQDRLNPAHTISAMVYRAANKFQALMVFPSIFKGEHIKKEKLVKILSGDKITVRFDRPTALQIDGETILGVSEYTMRAAAPAAKRDAAAQSSASEKKTHMLSAVQAESIFSQKIQTFFAKGVDKGKTK